MLMGRLPGSLPVTGFNGYTGAQRYITQPLPAYALPQPVPRAPVVPAPSAPPPAALPAAIEAWRAQLLAMHPFYLSRRFGMPVAQIRQILADPQTAALLYQQMRKSSHSNGVRFRGGEGGNSDVAGQRGVDALRTGMADLTLGNVASALDFGSRFLSPAGLVGLGLQGLGHVMFPGWIDSPLPNFTGQIDVEGLASRNPEIAAAIKDMQLDPIASNYRHNEARLRSKIEKALAQERAAAIANSGGMGRPGTPGAPRSTDGGGGSRSGSPDSSGNARGGGRGPSTTDRRDR